VIDVGDDHLSTMDQGHKQPVKWRRRRVVSPVLPHPVPVVCATGLSYRADGNRLQTLSLYLPRTDETEALVGTPVCELPWLGTNSAYPVALVHIHGGAWRSPDVTAASIEPTVACAFATPDDALLKVIASIDYTISPFPSAPSDSYDPRLDGHSDPAREAVHPQHLDDVLRAFEMLRSFGLSDGSYVLSGHSCGACLAFQAVLTEPAAFGLLDVCAPPTPAAVLGVNGLYDLPGLVHYLDASHAHLEAEYRDLLTIAFGADEEVWATASPARFELGAAASRLRHSGGLATILLEQSPDDQLVPMNQREKLARQIIDANVFDVIEGWRCSGSHATPWEQGDMMWRSILDVLDRYRSLKPPSNTFVE
jgi:acetyl esterase/lipase